MIWIFVLITLHLFQIVDNGIKICKGTNSEVDSYSVFWDNKKLTQTTLVSQLSEKNATDIYVCGLAYDVCVGEFWSVTSYFIYYKVNIKLLFISAYRIQFVTF